MPPSVWRAALLAGWLTSCAPSGPAAPAAILTPLPPLAATASPAASPATAQAASPAPTSSPLPSTPVRRPTPVQAAPAPTPTPGCLNDSQYLADLTAPDGAQFLPGQAFVKKWSVRNTGSCGWGPGYQLAFLSGDLLTQHANGQSRTEFALYPSRAGAAGVWEIPMRAPDQPGKYMSNWRARDPQGRFFGSVVYAKIEVVPLPATATLTATAAATSAP